MKILIKLSVDLLTIHKKIPKIIKKMKVIKVLKV